MNHYYLPVILIISSNVLYNVCTKSMPTKANPFFCLMLTYIISAALALVLFLRSADHQSMVQQWHHLNWAPFALGASLVVLEFGYILLYRMGWNISIGSLLCNIILAILLLAIGLFFYQEMLSVRQIFGILLCLGGLFLINQ